MNSVYIVIVISMVSTLLMAGFAFLWHHEVRAREIVEYTLGNALAENIALKGEVEDLRMARDEARLQRDKLNRENQDLHEKLRTQESFYKLYVNENVELTDKIDTLTTLVKDLNAENETLQKAVSQAVIPVRPVRKPAKKEGASE